METLTSSRQGEHDAPIRRKLTAIMFTDILQYSRRMRQDEQKAIGILSDHDAITEKVISIFQGRILTRIGDAVFAEFGATTFSGKGSTWRRGSNLWPTPAGSASPKPSLYHFILYSARKIRAVFDGNAVVLTGNTMYIRKLLKVLRSFQNPG